MQKQKVTIYDVANEAKVSMATVSRVVNGNNNVRKETRERVLAVIDRLHYQPNAVAQGLASKKTTTIGLIVPGFTNLHFAELAQGIDDIASLYKYNIFLSSLENKLVRDDQIIQNLLNKQVDGVIYMSNKLSPRASAAFKRSNTPVVLAGAIDSDEKMASVSIDYEDEIQAVMERMYKDGKRHLAMALFDADLYVNAEVRINKYKAFLAKHKLGAAHVYTGIASYEDGEKLFKQLQKDGIDGVLLTRDMSSAGVLNAALDAGVKIPEDLEIISTESTRVTAIVRPKLTRITQPLYDIGAVAMRLLTKLMREEEIDNRHIILPYQEIIGETTLNKK